MPSSHPSCVVCFLSFFSSFFYVSASARQSPAGACNEWRIDFEGVETAGLRGAEKERKKENRQPKAFASAFASSAPFFFPHRFSFRRSLSMCRLLLLLVAVTYARAIFTHTPTAVRRETPSSSRAGRRPRLCPSACGPASPRRRRLLPSPSAWARRSRRRGRWRRSLSSARRRRRRWRRSLSSARRPRRL